MGAPGNSQLAQDRRQNKRLRAHVDQLNESFQHMNLSNKNNLILSLRETPTSTPGCFIALKQKDPQTKIHSSEWYSVCNAMLSLAHRMLRDGHGSAEQQDNAGWFIRQCDESIFSPARVAATSIRLVLVPYALLQQLADGKPEPIHTYVVECFDRHATSDQTHRSIELLGDVGPVMQAVLLDTYQHRILSQAGDKSQGDLPPAKQG